MSQTGIYAPDFIYFYCTLLLPILSVAKTRPAEIEAPSPWQQILLDTIQ